MPKMDGENFVDIFSSAIYFLWNWQKDTKTGDFTHILSHIHYCIYISQTTCYHIVENILSFFLRVLIKICTFEVGWCGAE